jgi:hypothetical protein
MLAQLKLLKILQEDLNGRYRDLANRSENAAAAPAEGLTEVAREQGQLADLATKLAQPPDDHPEDNPEKLPDVRKRDAEPGPLPGEVQPGVDLKEPS